MITLVCVYNDRDTLDEFLIKSLHYQEGNYELILLDNTQKTYASAAEALNHGAENAKGNYLMFVHQDVYLPPDTSLYQLEKTLNSLSSLGVAGVAGTPGTKGEIISNVKHGRSLKRVSSETLLEPQKVQTVDECLFLVPHGWFEQLKFDPDTCPGWHLYGVDYCLKSLEQERNVYVIPLMVYHQSLGYSLSSEFYKTVERVIKKHKTGYEKIYTTIGYWSTGQPFIYQKIKHQIHWNWTLIKDKLDFKKIVKL